MQSGETNLSAGYQDLISICIPTYNRPDLLLIAIKSCLAQEYRPLEILIGDDSESADLALHSLRCPEGVSIKYVHNVPSLGQSANVNSLFARASGAKLVLLHDDDLFCPHGLAALVEGWRTSPDTVCVFGRQVAVTPAGTIDVANTIHLDCLYERDALKPGTQPSPVSTGLLQHLPNNCFLMVSDLARKTLYRSEREVGQAVDADFGIRLGLNASKASFVFVPQFVSAYRLTAKSIARSAAKNQDHHLIYQKISELSVPIADETAKMTFLTRIGPSSVFDAANAGDVQLAKNIMKSPHFRKPALSAHFAIATFLIACPNLGRKVRPLLKRVAKIGQTASILRQTRLRRSLKQSWNENLFVSQKSSGDLAAIEQIERQMSGLGWIRSANRT